MCGEGISLTEVPQFGAGAKPCCGVWCPPFPAVCKTGSTCPVPYGVSATVNDILMVNPAGVIDVLSLYTRSTSRLDLYAVIKLLSG